MNHVVARLARERDGREQKAVHIGRRQAVGAVVWLGVLRRFNVVDGGGVVLSEWGVRSHMLFLARLVLSIHLAVRAHETADVVERHPKAHKREFGVASDADEIVADCNLGQTVGRVEDGRSGVAPLEREHVARADLIEHSAHLQQPLRVVRRFEQMNSKRARIDDKRGMRHDLR